jgi:hypothetical protein
MRAYGLEIFGISSMIVHSDSWLGIGVGALVYGCGRYKTMSIHANKISNLETAVKRSESGERVLKMEFEMLEKEIKEKEESK